MSLSNIKPGKKGGKPGRLLLHAEKGIGKSAFAARCEIKDGIAGPGSKDVVFIPTEDGSSEIQDLPQYPKQTSFTGVVECVDDLIENEHKYKSVVIDTIDALYLIMTIGVTRRDFDNKLAKFNMYLAGDKVIAQELKVLLDKLDRLREEKNMQIIILSHTGTVNKKNPNGDDYIKNSGCVGKYTWGLLFGWSDICGHGGYDFKVKDGNAEEKLKGKVVQRDTERYIWFGGSLATEAKTRVGYELKSNKIFFTYKSYKEAQ